jgi:hypothetical protein
MPKKIKELKKNTSKNSKDAKPYQEKEVRQAIQEVKTKQENE